MKRTLFLFLALHIGYTYPQNPTVEERLTESPGFTFTMDYNNEDLVDIINYLAAKKNLNIILPTGANAIAAQVTLHLNNPMTLDQAWNMLQTILDLAGYSMVPQETMYVIIKNERDIAKEPLRLYIGTPPEQLPDSDEKIRYLYYLSNIKALETPDSELATVLKELLPDNAVFKMEPTNNAILIIDKARNIKSVMKVVVALDATVFQEAYEVIPLRHTSAITVASILNEELLKTPEREMYKYHLKQKEPEATYFSRFTKVIPEERSNSLIVLGKPQAIERIKELVLKEIDLELGSGESILHIYELQYLDAETFAPVLDKILNSSRATATGQSRAGEALGATERTFEGVIIKWDKPSQEAASAYSGGNRLIIAAKQDDWKIIKDFIEDMDKPMPQVIIEVLIADLTVDDTRVLGNMMRNPASMPLPRGVDIQSAQLAPVVLDSPPTTLAADLLRVDDAGISPLINTINTNNIAPTVFAISDPDTGRTWNVAEIVDNLDSSKVLSNPHFIATHNKQALIKVGEERLLPDQATSSAATTTITRTKQQANLEVRITPRIFTTIEGPAAEATINLDVFIDITQFTIGNTRETRTITTNANVKSKDILALGGLTSNVNDAAISGTPLLSRIPLIGWLFKKENATNREGNLTVFISPIVITPRGRAGVNRYTTDYVNLAQDYSKGGILFDQLRDPITRWFFKTTVETPLTSVKEFSELDERVRATEEARRRTDLVDNKKQPKKSFKDLLADEEKPVLRS